MLRGKSYLDSRMAQELPPEGETFTDLDKLVYAMGRIATAAPEIGLPQFHYGFYGYQQVTQEVVNRIGTNFFQDDAKMERTMPNFAERAFAPMRRYVNGEKVGAWSPMFRERAAQLAPPAIAMADFLTFHVRYDLAFSLEDTDTTPEHEADYSTKINSVLGDVGRELLPHYIEDHPLLERFKIPELGLKLVLYDLFKARAEAWEAFEELQSAKAQDEGEVIPFARFKRTQPRTVEEIDKNLSERATSKMLSTNKLASFVIGRVTRVPEGPWDLAEAA